MRMTFRKQQITLEAASQKINGSQNQGETYLNLPIISTANCDKQPVELETHFLPMETIRVKIGNQREEDHKSEHQSQRNNDRVKRIHFKQEDEQPIDLTGSTKKDLLTLNNAEDSKENGGQLEGRDLEIQHNQPHATALHESVIIPKVQCSTSKGAIPLCLANLVNCKSGNCETEIRILKEMKTMSQYLVHVPSSGSCESVSSFIPNMHSKEYMEKAYINGSDMMHGIKVPPEEMAKCFSVTGNQVMVTVNMGGNRADDAEMGEESVDDDVASQFMTTNNHLEIMRAAKALFSKKTRTLYHWMYPNTPKFQLKSAVSMAWEAMGMHEKQFYISQVLGKFGCLQNRLMINPQLGFLNPSSSTSQYAGGNDGAAESAHFQYTETKTAVSNLLNGGRSVSIVEPPSKKRGRPKSGPTMTTTTMTTMGMVKSMQQYNLPDYRAASGSGCGSSTTTTTTSSSKQFQQQLMYQQRYPLGDGELFFKQCRNPRPGRRIGSSNMILPVHGIHGVHGVKRLAVDVPESSSKKLCKVGGSTSVMGQLSAPTGQEDEFNDDPELRKELEKFQWTLHMVE